MRHACRSGRRWLVLGWALLIGGWALHAQPPPGPPERAADADPGRTQAAEEKETPSPAPPAPAEPPTTPQPKDDVPSTSAPEGDLAPSPAPSPSGEIPRSAETTAAPGSAVPSLPPPSPPSAAPTDRDRPADLAQPAAVTPEKARQEAQQAADRSEVVKENARTELAQARRDLVKAQRKLEKAKVDLAVARSAEAAEQARRDQQIAEDEVRLLQRRIAIEELRLQLADEENARMARLVALVERRDQLVGGRVQVQQAVEWYRDLQEELAGLQERLAAWQQGIADIEQIQREVEGEIILLQTAPPTAEDLQAHARNRLQLLRERAAAIEEHLSLAGRLEELLQQRVSDEAAADQLLDAFLQRRWLWARRQRQISMDTLESLGEDLNALPTAVPAWLSALPDWARRAWLERASPARLALGPLVLLAGAAMLWLLRTWGWRRLQGWERRAATVPGREAWETWIAALGRVALVTAQWGAALGGLWLGAATAQVPAAWQAFLGRATVLLVIYGGGRALTLEIFGPHQRERRPVVLSDSVTHYLTRWTLALLAYNVFCLLGLALLQEAGYRPDAAALARLVYQGGLLVLLLAATSRPWIIQELLPALSGRRPVVLRALYWLLAGYLLLLMTAYGLGYANLVNYLMVSSLLSLLVLIVVPPAQGMAHAALAWAISWPDRERDSLPLQGSTAQILYQTLQPATRGLVFLLSGWLLLRAWNIDWGLQDLAQLLTRPFNAQSETPLSLWSFIKLSLFIGGAFGLSALLRRGLQRLVYARPWFHWDAGIRHGITSAIHYGLLVFGFLKGLEAMGLSFSKLTVLSASFGVGLGFGLQDVFKNFVSGLIVLIDRPVKIGDYVEVAGKSGQVTDITARRTNVRTLDNQTIIVPNSTLISGNVINWTHGAPNVRLRLPVAIKNTVPLETVQERLLALARRHPLVLDRPAPRVRLTSLVAGGFNLELLVWTEAPERQEELISDLNFAVYRAFGEEGIELR